MIQQEYACGSTEKMALAHLLQKVSAEVATLGDLLAPVEEVLTDGLRRREVEPSDWAALQSLDALEQSIDALATYLHVVAEAVPPDSRVDARAALRAVALETIRSRLAGGSAGSADKADEADENGAWVPFF